MTENKPDMTFLKESPWSDTGWKFEQLQEMFLRDYVEEQRQRPDLGPQDLVDSAKNRFAGTLRALKQGGTSMGMGVVWGLTALNNYAGAWAIRQINEYKSMLKSNPEEAKKLRGKSVMVRITSDGKEEIIALDTRETFKSGKVNEKFGSPLPETTYLANFAATWKNSIDGKTYLVFSTVGGEMGGDEVVNPECPVCGTESYTKKCQNQISRGGATISCGGIKLKFIIEDVMNACGKASEFALKLREAEFWDDKAKKKVVRKIGPDLDSSTVFLGSKSLVIRYKKDDSKNFVREGGFRVLEGDMIDWIPKERILRGKALLKTWESLAESSNRIVFYPCIIYKIEERSTPFKTRNIWCQDDSMNALDEGIQCSIPDHVLEYQVKGKIGTHSEVLIVGALNRRKKKDPVTKQYTNEWLAPSIDVSCVIGINVVAPIVQVKEIEKVDFGSNYFDAGPTEISTSAKPTQFDKLISNASRNVPVGVLDPKIPSPTPQVETQVLSAQPEEKPSNPPAKKDEKKKKDSKNWF